jgi:hypothetical protein
VNCLRSRSPIEPRWRTPSSCPGEAGTAQIGISACAWPCGLTTSSLPNAKSLNMWIVVPVRLRCQFQPVGRVGGIQVNRSMRWRSENPVSGFRLTFPFTHRPGRERDVIGNASRPGIGKANFAVVFRSASTPNTSTDATWLCVSRHLVIRASVGIAAAGRHGRSRICTRRNCHSRVVKASHQTEA